MARIESNKAEAGTVVVRPTNKTTGATRTVGLEVATLREAVDVLEDRLDDVDERVIALESDTDADSPDPWESLARGSVASGDEVERALQRNPAEPNVVAPGIQELVPPSANAAGGSLSAQADPTQPRAPIGIIVALTDPQFEVLFGFGSARPDPVHEDALPLKQSGEMR
jgi:hypothetical protein